jgi:hypothetical protein
MDGEQQIQHQKELKARRKAWEEQRQAENEERARQEARGRMDAFLASRRRSWIDLTGSLPTPDTVENWKHEFVAERLADEEAERALRLAEAAGNSPL